MEISNRSLENRIKRYNKSQAGQATTLELLMLMGGLVFSATGTIDSAIIGYKLAAGIPVSDELEKHAGICNAIGLGSSILFGYGYRESSPKGLTFVYQDRPFKGITLGSSIYIGLQVVAMGAGYGLGCLAK